MKKVVTKVHISIVFLLIACFLSTTNISAKSTPKINHKSYNITISSTVTLKISNANTNVKWSSNRPSVAKIISKSGSKSYKAKIKGLNKAISSGYKPCKKCY